MEALKKIGIFLLLVIAFVGAVCSLGWLGYQHQWLPFAGELVVILFAVPAFSYFVKKLLD
ncbi:MAG: hypothetical protein KBS89_06920 [Bacteroidales bacterium]|nr:hypothetical protein [Candidatus Egerieousia equi]